MYNLLIFQLDALVILRAWHFTDSKIEGCHFTDNDCVFNLQLISQAWLNCLLVGGQLAHLW